MADSPDHADGEKVDPIKASPSDSPGSETPPEAGDGASAGSDFPKDLHKNLPMVLSPKLDAGEDETVEETAEKPAEEAAAAAPAPTSSSRFLLLAATVAFIAAFSSFVGSVSGSGFAHFYFPAAPAGASVQVSAADTTALQQMKAELAALKAEVDSTMRGTNGQYSKIADRLDRLDQHFASADTTGSIAANTSTAPAPEQPKITDRILQDWVVQGVQNGRALVESRYGGVFDVGAGSVLPGVGRIDSIKRQDGQWLVLTARGTITSGR